MAGRNWPDSRTTAMANAAAEGSGWMRGMFRKHQDGSRASLSRGLAAMHVILLSTGGARGVRLSHSSAPQRGRGPADWRAYRWERPLEPFPLPNWHARRRRNISRSLLSATTHDSMEQQQQTIHVGQIGASILPSTTHAPIPTTERGLPHVSGVSTAASRRDGKRFHDPKHAHVPGGGGETLINHF